MLPNRDVGGVARPGRGEDVDLEALQDAFVRSAERPSAKVTRSKVIQDLNLHSKYLTSIDFACCGESVKQMDEMSCFASHLPDMWQQCCCCCSLLLLTL